MTALDAGRSVLRTGFSALRTAAMRAQAFYERAPIALKSLMPKGLFARALLIIIVPMVVRGRMLGTLTFGRGPGERPYTLEDLRIVMEVARRATVGILHAELYRERSHIAHTLQRSLLPPRLPDIAGFELAARYRAAGEGFDVGVCLNADLEEHPEVLDGASLYLSVGHDEYWSKPMRDAAEAARDAGINLAFFGGNDVY